MDTLTGKIKTAFEAAGEIYPGDLINIEVQHDPDCPAIRTGRLTDCRCTPIVKRIPEIRSKREINGIVINLPGTESTGFSPVGSLTRQIVDGLRPEAAERQDGRKPGQMSHDLTTTNGGREDGAEKEGRR